MRPLRGNEHKDDFAGELAAYEACLAESRAAPMEEAVPAEMMQVFSDEQWPELLFEFQPSLRLFAARRDVVGWSRRRDCGERQPLPEAGPERSWIIFRRSGEQLVRSIEEPEHSAFKLALNGENFAAMASALWPKETAESAHYRMTELLLKWLGEGLVIDVGVPLPEDAEFEAGS